jgi:hypothetical protein
MIQFSKPMPFLVMVFLLLGARFPVYPDIQYAKNFQIETFPTHKLLRALQTPGEALEIPAILML